MGLAKATQTSVSRVGAIRPHHNSTAPTGWVLCNGGAYTRADPNLELFASLSFPGTFTTVNGSTTVVCTSGVVPAGTLASGVTARIEIPGAVTSGANIIAGQGTTTLTLSVAATATGTFSGTVLPHGASGTSDFYVPRLTGRVPRHAAIINHKGGRGAVILDSTQLPSHTHLFTDIGHRHWLTSYPTHTHGLGPAGAFAGGSGPHDTAGGTGGDYAPSYNEAANSFSSTLSIGISEVNAFPANTASAGSASPSHSNLQPSLSTAYIIRARV